MRRAECATARTLGAFRVAVVALLLLSPEKDAAQDIARLDPSLRFAPEGLGWFVAHVPVSPWVAGAARQIFLGSAGCALAGLFTRSALVVTGISAFYLLALCQLTGQVLHDMHLLWFVALLAASPSGDGLSVDAWLSGRRRRAPRAEYNIPLAFARLLLGAVYFFPGFWKLRTSGLAWITSDNLRNQMYWKWAQWGGWTPPVRVDLHPTLVSLGAAAVVAFELLFVVLVLFPRARRPAALGGFVFHQLSELLLHIPFVSLWGSYVCLLGPSRSGARPRRRRAALARVVGAALLAGATIQGVRGQTQAFPFACYPTFQHVLGPEMPDLRLVALGPDGRETPLPGPLRSQSEWGMAWQIAGLWGSPASFEALSAFAAADARRLNAPPDTLRLRVLRAWISVEPGHLGDPPLRSEVLGEVPFAR